MLIKITHDNGDMNWYETTKIHISGELDEESVQFLIRKGYIKPLVTTKPLLPPTGKIFKFFKQRCFAFDVDETLEISNGPIKIADIKALYDAGHIVGICGNWSHFVKVVPEWYKMVSFIGQFYGYTSKTVFLSQLKSAINVEEYIMIGNDPAHFGNSNDIQAAKEAGWTFIREDQFNLRRFLEN